MPVKNDGVLQFPFIKKHGKELKLILNCKIRWSNFLAMLERFFMLEKQIKVALIQLDASLPFSMLGIEIMKKVIEALKPFKVTVNTSSS